MLHKCHKHEAFDQSVQTLQFKGLISERLDQIRRWKQPLHHEIWIIELNRRNHVGTCPWTYHVSYSKVIGHYCMLMASYNLSKIKQNSKYS